MWNCDRYGASVVSQASGQQTSHTTARSLLLRQLLVLVFAFLLVFLLALAGCWEPDTRTGVYDPCHRPGLGDLFEPVGC